MEDNERIDFVITWVDGGDIEWQKERNKYAGKDPEDLADYRFRDWDNLKYWFRGVEKFAPWVNNIFFVTNGQKPEWLNVNHPKLKWIKHEDYIPKEYLPTFSSHPIELNFHRIKELSEKFVYFNDDLFLTNNVSRHDFFNNGLPNYYAQLDINVNGDEQFEHIVLNDAQLINRHFVVRNVVNNNKKVWFNKSHSIKTKIRNYVLSRYEGISALRNLHLPFPLLKSTIEYLWKIESECLNKTCKNRFRNSEDVNQYVFSWFDIFRGNCSTFDPKSGRYFALGNCDETIANSIMCNKYKMICINDTGSVSSFETTKKLVNDAFEAILPEKCSFEL